MGCMSVSFKGFFGRIVAGQCTCSATEGARKKHEANRG